MTSHQLVEVQAITANRAFYVCGCGFRGSATIGHAYSTEAEVRARAVKNHEMHHVRALIRERRS